VGRRGGDRAAVGGIPAVTDVLIGDVFGPVKGGKSQKKQLPKSQKEKNKFSQNPCETRTKWRSSGQLGVGLVQGEAGAGQVEGNRRSGFQLGRKKKGLIGMGGGGH